MPGKLIVWFRKDLRLHDHRALAGALKREAEIIPVYIFDRREFETTAFGFPKTGAHRAKFLIESVRDLRENLRKIGSELIVRVGMPEKILPDMARDLGATGIFFSKEATDEEIRVEEALESAVAGKGISLASFWDSTLYLPEDIPYSMDKIPVVFSTFRKGVEKRGRVKPPVPAPEQLPEVKEVDPGLIPNLDALGLALPAGSPLAQNHFKGGETAALERLQHYFWETHQLKKYKYTRNGLLGTDFSSKFSPWLAHGCISPRWIYEEVKTFEREVTSNVSTYWLIFELIWRDYFRYWAVHHGNSIFHHAGIHPENEPETTENWELFKLWARGATGMPFIDANMRELNATGFMSNRGRQNVASFLVKDLKVNWLMGAEYFESQLVDYAPCSNYGNWAYVAGVGADPRKDRYFNVMSQALRYDPKGEYVRHWLPELAAVPDEKIHYVFELDALQQACFQVKPGENYPEPAVRPKSWGVFDPQK